MKLGFCLFLFLPLFGYVDGHDMHFAGGSMSFKFINMTHAPYKLKITAVTGWVIGLGPCGTSCNASDIGKKTRETRKELIDIKGEDYFGKWTTEMGVTLQDKHYKTITTDVVSKIEGHVAAVNVPMKWEQEIAEVILDIDPTTLYTDVSLTGRSWRWFNYTLQEDSDPVDFRLQIKVKPAQRKDTMKPNNSPVAMFKPVYKIKLNTTTTIKLSTMDQDGDFVRCSYAEFVSAGGLGTLMNTIVNPDCSIVIDAQVSDGFVDGGWGAVPVKVMDFPSKPLIDSAISHEQSTTGLGAINVQFMIQTLSKIDAPVFVDPTVESQHVFNVYVGSTLRIPLYAKPMKFSVEEIYSFYVRSIPTRAFNVDPAKDDPTRTEERVKFSSVTWRPGKSDVGEYLISALVTNTKGSDGTDRNYNILVKDTELSTTRDPPHGGPYFPVFPDIVGVVCMIHSTCSFPIYSKTNTPSPYVSDVKFTTSTFQATTISRPEATTKDGKQMFVSNVQVHASEGGEQKICFEAIDSKSKASDIKCLGVKVELPDPCKSNPCIHGICISEGQSYVCDCGELHRGRHCELEIDFCSSNPCQNNGKCSNAKGSHFKCDCAGTEHIGPTCKADIVDCKLGVCGPHGVCKDLDGRFECDCFSGYYGDNCNMTDSNCQGVSCENGGFCIVEDGTGVCKCPLGYSGQKCKDNTSISTVNIGPGGIKDNSFIAPSLPNGAEFDCYVNRVCMIPVYSKIPTSGTHDVKVGLHSPDVTASVLSSVPDPAINALKSLVKIDTTKPGLHTFCVNSGSTETDTLCYKVKAKVYENHPAFTSMMPTFKPPTPPDHSIINCIQGKPCHTVITTDLNPFTKNCTLFSGSTSAIVFKVLTSKVKCETNVLFNPPATGNTEVCLQAGQKNELQGRVFQGERRCFTLRTTKDNCSPNPCTPGNGGKCLLQPGGSPLCICPDSATGDSCQYTNPCSTNPCKNGGVCDSKDTSYECKCPVGYEGTDCDAITSTTEPEFTDPSLKNGATIECEVGKTCVIPMFTKGPSAELVEGPKDGDVDFKLTKPVGKAGHTINEGQLEVTPNTSGYKKVCVTTKSSPTKSGDILCYHIKTKPPGKITLGTDNFELPSLPNGSTFKCPEKTQCHLVMHSKPNGPSCHQVKEDEVGKVDFHIFSTKLESGSCVTDVVVKPTLATDLQKFCLKAREGDNPRCFKVDPNKAEPCKMSSCRPNGNCIVETDHNAACVCDYTHRGTSCNEPAPCKSSPCHNSAVCEETGVTFKCHCSVGYKGTLCDESTDVQSTSKPTFTNAILSTGSTFNCVKGKVCKIPISIAKPNDLRPVLETGPHDKGLTIKVPHQPSKDTDIPGRSDLYKGYVDVTPTDTGDKKVCVSTGHTSLTGKSKVDDTVCYHLHVTETDTETDPTDSFQEPTPRGGSQIRCIPTEDCHFLVHSKTKDGECPQVEASSGKANVFPSRKDVTFTDCITDVSVSASELTGSPKTICLRARTDPDKPQRCFQVSSKPQKDPCIAKGCDSDNGPCILEKNDSAVCVCEEGSTLESCLVKCRNGGKRDSNQECQCTLGYSGTTCAEGPKENPDSKPKYADNNVANGGTIKCIIDQKCTFPVYAQSGKGGTTSPKVSPGVKSPDVDVSVDTPTKLTPSTGVPGLYSAPVSVTAHKDGINKVCLKLEEADKKSVCYNIDVTDGGIPTSPTKFISPTLPEGSHIKCVMEVCHLFVHTQQDPACTQVTLSEGDGIAFKTKEKGQECITDVIYKPTSTSKELCIGSGESSDERCYKVQKSTDSCASKECSDCGACLISGNHPECVCEPGMTGSKCETDIDKCSNGGKEDGTGKCKCPLGYSGETCEFAPIGNTDSKPKYADNNMLNGGTIKCEKDEECTFPVYTNVPNTDKTSSLVTQGPTSPGVKVKVDQGTDLNKETTVPGLFKTPVTITPHKSGASKVCLELSKADEKSVCYNIDVTDGSTKPKQTTFLEPTLPDESSVLCKTKCHMLVHTKPDPECKQVTTSDSTDTVFSTKEVGTECVTDILYKAETTDKKLCINSGSHSEQRCYHVKKPTDDPCSSKTCNNGGACVNVGSTGECVCKPGFGGVSCENSQGGCQNGGEQAASGKCLCPIGFTMERCKTAVAGNTGSESKFAQSNLENGGTIKCITGQPCTFPVEALPKDGSNNPPVLSTGPTSGDINVDIDPPQPIGDKTKVPDMYSIPVTLKAAEPGTKKVCLKLDGGRTNGVCYSVDVGNEVNTESSIEPTFLTPTLPAKSIVPCKDEHCHMIVHTKPDPNTGCKQVTTDNVENKAFATVMSTDGKECLTDVAFSKEVTAGSQLCINAGKSGEKRCYTVENSNKYADPCKTATCSDHGMCLRKEADPECVCDEGYTGATCQTSVAKTLGVDIQKPHIIEPTMSNGSLLQCEDGKPCKIRVVATAGSPGSTLEKPEVDGIDSGSSTPVKDDKDNFYTDVTVPLGNGPQVSKHCITLKTSTWIVGDPWCVFINRNPTTSSLTPHTGEFQEPTLPDGSVIPCTIGTTCTIPVTTALGKKLKDPTDIDLPHRVEKDENEYKIKMSPTDKDEGDHEVCVEMTGSSGKKCYKVRVQQNPDALLKVASLKPDGTGTPDASTKQLKKPKVIGPSPMNGTTVTCNSAGCHLKLIVETPQSTTGGEPDVTSTGTSGAISKLSSTKIAPNQHSVDVSLKPDPTGPDHQTMCMEVTVSSTTSSPWCVDVNVDKSGSSSGSSTSPPEATESTVPCHIGSTCIIPVTTSISSPLLTPTDKSASVQGSTLSPGGKAITHTVAVTPTSSMAPVQKICLDEKASASDVATGQKCVNIEVLPEVKSLGLGIDTREPHVLKPTLTSGTVIPCETSCQVDVVVDPGNQPDSGVELVPTKGTFKTTDIVATPDGKYKMKLDITSGSSTVGLQPVCFKVKNKRTGHVGDEWCANVNPTPDKSKNPPTSSGSTSKDIVSTSLPPNTELTCTVGTTCSVDIKTAPGAGAPVVTTPGPLKPTVTKDTTDPHEHTLSLTPSKDQIGEHKICVKVKSEDLCYNMKITPNPKDIGNKGDESPSNNPDAPCGANDNVDIVGPADTSTIACSSTGCSFHVLVKPPTCNKGSRVKINPETPGQISQGPVSSVGSLKDVIVTVPQTSGGPSEEVCMSPDMEPSLPGSAGRYCVTLDRSKDGSKDENIGTPTLVKCELDSECVIPIATTPDRLLSGSPEVNLLAPTITDGQSLQPVVYHAKSPGKHQLCLNAAKTSRSDDIKRICTTIEVTPPETTTDASTTGTTQAPGTGTPKDFIQPEHLDLTKPHVLEPSSTPGSTIQCYAGSPCKIPLVVDTGAHGSSISEVLVNKEKVDSKTSNHLSGNKYSTVVQISTSDLKTGTNPRCIALRTSTKESDPYCVYVNYQPKKTPSATASPDNGLDLDHSLPKESVIECVIGKTCSIPFTEKSSDPFLKVNSTIPNTLQSPNKNNPLERTIIFTPSVGTSGTKKVCIGTESQSESCYALHIKTSTSRSTPNGSGGKQTNPNSGKKGFCSVPTVHNKPKIMSPLDGSRIECSSSNCKIELQVESQLGDIDKVTSENSDVALISSIPVNHRSTIVMISLTPSSDKACVKVVEDHCQYSSDSVCFVITHSNEITEQVPEELKGHPTSSHSVVPLEVKCLEGSSCSIIIPTDSTRPYLLPTDSNTEVPNKVMTPDKSHILHEVVVPSGSVGSHSICLDSMATVFDKSPEKICFNMETVSADSQCSSKPLSKTVAMKAYGGGGMLCTCKNGAVKTVMKPPVSNGQLLRVAGLGFGGGVGIMAIGALVYLAVTKIQRMSKEKSKKDLYDMKFN